MQNPSESQQNICRTHQNLNKTYAQSIRISIIPMQNSSELQQKIHQNLDTIHTKSINIKHTRPQPPEQQNLDHALQPAPECRSCGPESPCSLGRSHMSYILKRKRQRDIDINISKATNTQLHNISYKIFNLT
jgi:hypothetical protein